MFRQLVTTMEISLVIASFDLACLLSTFLHAKTIIMMGRKNAILIGFAVNIVTLILLALLSYMPSDYPKTFVWANILVRFVQGYGDSLTFTTNFSLIGTIF